LGAPRAPGLTPTTLISHGPSLRQRLPAALIAPPPAPASAPSLRQPLPAAQIGSPHAPTTTPTPTRPSQDSVQDQDRGDASVVHASARRAQPSSSWLNLWGTRLGTNDRALLLRTLPSSDNMSTSQPFAANLSTLGAAAMTRQPFSRVNTVMPRATRPLECTRCDLLSISNLDMPATESGVRHGMKYGVVFVDDFSRHMRVYFCTGNVSSVGLI
jgi:hypothetical protein